MPKPKKDKLTTETKNALLKGCLADPICGRSLITPLTPTFQLIPKSIKKPIKKKKFKKLGPAPKPKQIKKATPKPVARSYSGLHPDYPYRDGTSTFGGTSMSHSFSAPKSAAKRKIQTKKVIRKGKRGAKK